MYNFADRMKNVKASDVREILKVTARPEIISFAGGLPAPELFPIEPIREASDAVLRESGRVALQVVRSLRACSSVMPVCVLV